ncbi:MAG: Uncharacterised protein [Bacteroidetes bacterium MED-G17]|nr:MAG: Uncharacterised protein [Bacteroidetes bacterium MED-G17]
MQKKTLAIIIPCYNEANRLPIENYKYPKNVQNACADALIGLSCGQFSSKDMAEVISVRWRMRFWRF